MRGGNASADSFAKLMANLVAAYAVDFQTDLFSGAASVSVVWSEGFGSVLSSFPGAGRILSEPVSGTVLCKEAGLDGSTGIKAVSTSLDS